MLVADKTGHFCFWATRDFPNWVATGGAQRNDAMKSNGTKGSPLAAAELSQKSVTEQKTEWPQAVPREMMWWNEKNWQGSLLAVPEQQKTESTQVVHREMLQWNELETNTFLHVCAGFPGFLPWGAGHMVKRSRFARRHNGSHAASAQSKVICLPLCFEGDPARNHDSSSYKTRLQRTRNVRLAGKSPVHRRNHVSDPRLIKNTGGILYKHLKGE